MYVVNAFNNLPSSRASIDSLYTDVNISPCKTGTNDPRKYNSIHRTPDMSSTSLAYTLLEIHLCGFYVTKYIIS